MIGTIKQSALILIALVLPEFAATPLFAKEPPFWKGNIELSYVQTSGNTDSLSLLTAGKVQRRLTRSKFTAEAKGIYGKKGDVTSDKSWNAMLKYDHSLTDRLSLFALESVERNTLKGIEFRFIHQGGIGYYFMNTPTDTLEGQAGAGYTQEDLIDPFDNRELPTSRLFIGYVHTFTETNLFEQTIEYLLNLKDEQDYIINEESALTTNLMGNFALKISFALTYDNVPTENFQKMDRLFKTALLYTF